VISATALIFSGFGSSREWASVGMCYLLSF
jgi:hypothetical protein